MTNRKKSDRHSLECRATRKVDFQELFREEHDVSAILEAFGEEPPETLAAARTRVLELTTTLQPTRIVGDLMAFARRFAQMAEHIAQFCGSHGVAIGGQVQLTHD